MYNQNESGGQSLFLPADFIIVLGSVLYTCPNATSCSQVDGACMCDLSRVLGCISISVIVGCQGVVGIDGVMVCSLKSASRTCGFASPSSCPTSTIYPHIPPSFTDKHFLGYLLEDC